MNRTFALATWIATLALAACGGSEPTSNLIAAKPNPTGAPAPCDDIQGQRCIIKVGAAISGNTCTVTVKEFIALGGQDSVKNIEWQVPNGFKFCTQGGDGVFAAGTVGPFDPEPNGPCKQTFRWKRIDKDDTNYAYSMRFRNEAGTISCVKDPWIRNG